MNETGRVKRPVQTTVTSIEILELLKRHNGMTLSEITNEFELARSTIHRHLLTLQEQNLVERQDATYYVGLRFLDFGLHARNRLQVFDVARDQIEKLAEGTGEVPWLVAKDGDMAIFLYKAGDHPKEPQSRVGRRRHLHQLASGKSILAYLPEEERHEIIERRGLPARTGNTVCDYDTLSEELASIRERGYAFNRQESIEDMNAVAAPIQDESGYPLAAVSISGSARRLEEEYVQEELIDDILATIETIQLQFRFND